MNCVQSIHSFMLKLLTKLALRGKAISLLILPQQIHVFVALLKMVSQNDNIVNNGNPNLNAFLTL